MKLNKLLEKILFTMLIFFSFSSVVFAEDSYSMLCIDGYSYNIKVSQPNYDFGKLIGKTSRELNMSNIISGNGHFGDARFEYALNGYYYGENSKLNNRCYTYINYNPPVTNIDNSGNTITTQTYSATLKQCGSKYDIKLNFDNNSKLINSLIDDMNQQVKDEYKEIYSSNIIESNGKISLVIRPDSNSKLLDVWDRVGVSVSYNGTKDFGKTGKGNCTVYGGNSNKLSDKYIKCTNITPYQVVKDNNSDKILNKSLYQIYIYLNGINKNDFIENVSDDIKQGYVNSCGGTNGSIFLGYIITNIIGEDVIAVDNPARIDGSHLYNICNELNSIRANQEMKKVYVSECYKEKISYVELEQLETNIRTKVNNLKRMFENIPDDYIGLADVGRNGELVCTDRRMGIPALDKISIPFESKIVYEDYDGYWGMVCIEDYYVDGGVPSLVEAGTGVLYDNKVQINKTCMITQLKTVKKKPQCVTHSTCSAYYDHGNDGIFTSGDTNGGPNDNFDSCIKTCDGGKYTQSCINSCYSSVYSDSRSSLFNKLSLSNYNFMKRYNNIINLATFSTTNSVIVIDPTSVTRGEPIDLKDGFTVTIYNEVFQEDINGDGNPDFNCTDPSSCLKAVIRDKNGVTVDESGSVVGCNANLNVICTSYSGPPGCSENAQEEYENELLQSKAELAKLEELAKKYSQLEEYSISFTDSANGYIYKINGNTKANIEDKPQLDINLNEELTNNKVNTTTYTIGDQGNTIVGTETSTVSTVYDVLLPKAHVKKDDADLIVVENPSVTSDANKYYSYSLDKGISSSEYTFKRYPKYNSSLFTDGQKVFYTDFNSPLYNVLVNSGKSQEELDMIDTAAVNINGEVYIYELFKDKLNIKIDLKVGYFEEDGFISFDPSKFNCYYGVYRYLIEPEDTPSPPPSTSPPTPTPTNTPTPPPTTTPIPTPTTSPPPTTPPSTYIPIGPSGLRYYYREIYLEPENNGYGGIFPNGRKPRWNWTGTIKNGVATGAASNSDPSYIVDPEKLIKEIERKGDSIYTNQSEYDYVFTLTPNLINEIRKYNNSKIDGKKITYLDFSLAGTEKNRINYSQKIKDWYGDSLYHTGLSITDCNNAVDSKCYNY